MKSNKKTTQSGGALIIVLGFILVASLGLGSYFRASENEKKKVDSYAASLQGSKLLQSELNRVQVALRQAAQCIIDLQPDDCPERLDAELDGVDLSNQTAVDLAFQRFLNEPIVFRQQNTSIEAICVSFGRNPIQIATGIADCAPANIPLNLEYRIRHQNRETDTKTFLAQRLNLDFETVNNYSLMVYGAADPINLGGATYGGMVEFFFSQTALQNSAANESPLIQFNPSQNVSFEDLLFTNADSEHGISTGEGNFDLAKGVKYKPAPGDGTTRFGDDLSKIQQTAIDAGTSFAGQNLRVRVSDNPTTDGCYSLVVEANNQLLQEIDTRSRPIVHLDGEVRFEPNPNKPFCGPFTMMAEQDIFLGDSIKKHNDSSTVGLISRNGNIEIAADAKSYQTRQALDQASGENPAEESFVIEASMMAFGEDGGEVGKIADSLLEKEGHELGKLTVKGTVIARDLSTFARRYGNKQVGFSGIERSFDRNNLRRSPVGFDDIFTESIAVRMISEETNEATALAADNES